MANVYLKHPHLLSNTTDIRQSRKFDSGETAVVLGQNIIRPPGGGQPHDHGSITIGSSVLKTGRVFKADGETWIAIEGSVSELPEVGEMVYVEVDADRRRRLSRCHSLGHLMMAAARHIVTGFDSKGAGIHDDERTVTIRFRAKEQLTEEQVGLIDALTRHFVLKDAPIRFSNVKSREEGAKQFPNWRIDSDLGLTGSIRVVNICGIDSNPCAGTHVNTTAEVVAFAMQADRSRTDDLVTVNATIAEDWTYWFPDAFLTRSALIDLQSFEAR